MCPSSHSSRKKNKKLSHHIHIGSLPVNLVLVKGPIPSNYANQEYKRKRLISVPLHRISLALVSLSSQRDFKCWLGRQLEILHPSQLYAYCISKPSPVNNFVLPNI